MEKSMTPSLMTAGQIGKIQELVGAGLRKANLPSEPVQQVLETQGDQIVAECVDSVRRRVEAISEMIVRRVKVDRSRTPQQILDATGRKQYTNCEVVKNILRGEGEEMDVYFFKIGRWVSPVELEKEYESCGFKADPYAQAQVNIDDKVFADQYPNGTHWKDADGRWCFAAFSRWSGERRVYVYRCARGWIGYWWFAGVRK